MRRSSIIGLLACACGCVYLLGQALTHNDSALLGVVQQVSSGGSSFSPSDVAGLYAWYDGASYSASTGTWDDKTTNNLDLTQSNSSYRPAKGTVNGLDCLLLDGSNDGIYKSSGLQITNYASLFMVANLSNISAFSVFYSLNDRIFRKEDNTLNFASGNTASVLTNVFIVYILTYDNTTISAHTNNVLAISNPGDLAVSANGCGVGYSYIYDNQYFGGAIAEFLIYTNVVSAESRTNIYNYLKNRYGL